MFNPEREKEEGRKDATRQIEHSGTHMGARTHTHTLLWLVYDLCSHKGLASLSLAYLSGHLHKST